jgi:hypothetical protein
VDWHENCGSSARQWWAVRDWVAKAAALAEDDGAVLSTVRRGLGTAIMPALSPNEAPDGLEETDLGPSAASRSVGCITTSELASSVSVSALIRKLGAGQWMREGRVCAECSAQARDGWMRNHTGTGAGVSENKRSGRAMTGLTMPRSTMACRILFSDWFAELPALLGMITAAGALLQGAEHVLHRGESLRRVNPSSSTSSRGGVDLGPSECGSGRCRDGGDQTPLISRTSTRAPTTRVSKAGWGAVAGPPTFQPSASRKTLPCQGHRTQPSLTAPSDSGPPM